VWTFLENIVRFEVFAAVRMMMIFWVWGLGSLHSAKTQKNLIENIVIAK
jgi:hypothetical protein